MPASGPAAAGVVDPLGDRPRRHLERLLSVWGAAAVFAIVAGLYYGPGIFKLGWYLDDWALVAAMQDAPSHAWTDLFEACRTVDPAARPGGCAYHATIYTLFGHTIRAYHLYSVALLVLGSVLIYALLVRLRLPRWAALAIGVLYIVYPGSDTTRLWPASIGAQYILAAYLGGVLLALAALRRPRRIAVPLHVLSLALFGLLVFTYEVVLPLIAIGGVFYLVARAPRRAALARATVDLALAGGFTAYRLFLAPVPKDSGFVMHRNPSQSVERLLTLWRGAWASWQPMFIPGPIGPVVLVAALVLVVVTAARRPAVRPRLRPWLWLALAAAAFALVAVTPYFVANDYYVPDPRTPANRLNLAAAPAYCALAVALLAMVGIALRAWSNAIVAFAVPLVLALGFVVHQTAVSFTSQEDWAQAWREEIIVVNAFKRLFGPVPRYASIVSFGHPLYAGAWIPVFSTDWDLRGAIDSETHVDPDRAMPFTPDLACGELGVLKAGALFMPYAGPSPVWFASSKNFEVRHVRSKAQCDRAVVDFGRPPYFLPEG
jgi:hypothetical protein